MRENGKVTVFFVRRKCVRRRKGEESRRGEEEERKKGESRRGGRARGENERGVGSRAEGRVCSE